MDTVQLMESDADTANEDFVQHLPGLEENDQDETMGEPWTFGRSSDYGHFSTSQRNASKVLRRRIRNGV